MSRDASAREAAERDEATAQRDRLAAEVERLRAREAEAWEALREWVEALRSLRDWMHDKSTARDDAETDRRYARVLAAEKAGAALARASDPGNSTEESMSDLSDGWGWPSLSNKAH